LSTADRPFARPTAKRVVPRRPWLAALLSFLAPGVGQLYNGDPRRGWSLFALFVGLEMTEALIIPHAALIVVFAGFLLITLSELALKIATAIQAFRLARRIGATQITWYQHAWIYVLLVLLISVAGAAAAAAPGYRIQSFYIPSDAMKPTILVGDYLNVDKSYYRSYSAKRGDVVVFKQPTDNSTDYIKRVIGLPGDRIQMKNGVLYINDRPCPRKRIVDYLYLEGNGAVIPLAQYIETLPNGVKHRIIKMGDNGPLDNTQVYDVPPGKYFMMGDNRDNSQDSRILSAVGYVPAGNLIGRAEFIFFSTDGSARLSEFWAWPFAIRFGRLFHGVS
jgi:signal peptidase I